MKIPSLRPFLAGCSLLLCISSLVGQTDPLLADESSYVLQENFDEADIETANSLKTFGKVWDMGGLWRVFDLETGPFLISDMAHSSPNSLKVLKTSPICMVIFDRLLENGKITVGFAAMLESVESGIDVVISGRHQTGGPNPNRTLSFQVAPNTHEIRLPRGRGTAGTNQFVPDSVWVEYEVEIDFNRKELAVSIIQDDDLTEIVREPFTGDAPVVDAIRFSALGEPAEASVIIDDVWIKQSPDKEVIDIGSRRELFVDDYLTAKIKNLEVRLHHPVEREVVMEFNAPWEGNASGYVTVFEDNGTYRMYYRGSNISDPSQLKKTMSKQYACYAESKDGIHWVRPQLGIVEYQGSTNNNIILDGPGSHNFSPFIDGNPEDTLKSPYKAIASAGETLDAKTAGGFLYVFGSEDAIHWHLLSEEPVLSYGAFDSHNVAFWDPTAKEYREFHRGFREVRSIMYTTSKDFLNWEYPGWLAYTKDAPQEHLYTNAIQFYPRAPHLLIGFPTRFVPDRKKIDHPISGVSDSLFMVSRNGTQFRRYQEAFLPPGNRPERWLSRNNMMALGMLFLPPTEPGGQEEISFYSTENFFNTAGEGTRLRRYTLRVDGFVSLHAGGQEGELLTEPFLFTGSGLFLNYSTSAAGGVEVEVTDAAGSALPNFSRADMEPIFGDEIERKVQWKNSGDLAALQGTPVRLRFYLKDADIYAFQFR